MDGIEQQRPLALITGASGGIGEAFAHLLAAEGYELVIASRKESELNRVKGLIGAKLDVPVTVIGLDLSRQDAGEILQNELEARNQSPDVLINNAGFGLLSLAVKASREEQLNMIDLNVRTLTDLTLRFLPAMLARKRGGVINVASIAAFFPGPYMAVYYATKGYVMSFTDALSSELKGRGVTLTSLCPGPVITGFQSRAGMTGLKALKYAGKVTAQDVALAGWNGFKAGKRVVLPAPVDAFTAYFGRLLPRRVMMPFLKSMQRPPQR